MTPGPRATVSPAYWGNPAAFGGERRERWEYDRVAAALSKKQWGKKHPSKKQKASRLRLLLEL